MGMISKLEAINRMLLNSGEQIVTSLDDEVSVDLSIAKYILNQTTRDYQLRGLVNNQDILSVKQGAVTSVSTPSTETANTETLQGNGRQTFKFDTGLELDVVFTARYINSLSLTTTGLNYKNQVLAGDGSLDSDDKRLINSFGAQSAARDGDIRNKSLLDETGQSSGITGNIKYRHGVAKTFEFPDPAYTGSGFTTGDLVRIKPVNTFGDSDAGGTYLFNTSLLSDADVWPFGVHSVVESNTDYASCWGGLPYNSGGVEAYVTAESGGIRYFEDGDTGTAPQKTSANVLIEADTGVTNALYNFYNLSTTTSKSYPGSGYSTTKVKGQKVKYLSAKGSGKNARADISVVDGVVKTLGDFKDRGKEHSAGSYALVPPAQSGYQDDSASSRASVTITVADGVLPEDIESDDNRHLALEDAGELDSTKFSTGQYYTFDSSLSSVEGTTTRYTKPTSYTGDDGIDYDVQIQGYVNQKVLNPTIFNYQIIRELTSNGSAAYEATGFTSKMVTSDTKSTAGATCKAFFYAVSNKILDVQLVDGGYGWEEGDVITFTFTNTSSVPASPKTSSDTEAKTFSYTIASSNNHPSGRHIISTLGIQKLKSMPAGSLYRGEGLWQGGTTDTNEGSIASILQFGINQYVGDESDATVGFDFDSDISAGRQLYYIEYENSSNDVKNAIVQGIEDSDGLVTLEAIVDSGFGYVKDDGSDHVYRLKKVSNTSHVTRDTTVNLGFVDGNRDGTTHGSAGAAVHQRAITGPLIKMKREITSANKHSVADASYPTSGALSAETNFAPSFYFYTTGASNVYNDSTNKDTLYNDVVKTATLRHNGANYTASTTQEYEIFESTAGTAGSLTAFTFSSFPAAGQTIQIISTDGTTKTYEASSSANGTVLRSGNIAFIRDGSPTAEEAAIALKAAIEHANGHNGKITVARATAQLTFTQATDGAEGNTTVTVSSSWNDAVSGTVASAFTGGISSRASLYISEVLDGVIHDVNVRKAGSGYTTGDLLTIERPTSSGEDVVLKVAEVSDGAITSLRLRYPDVTDTNFTSFGWGYPSSLTTSNQVEFAVTQVISSTGTPTIHDGTNFDVRGSVGGNLTIESGVVYEVTNFNSAASCFIKFTGVPTNDQTIVIKDAAGTSKTYTAKSANAFASNQFNKGSSAQDSATNLKSAIEHASGHNGTILVERDGPFLTLTQQTQGALASANRTITNGLSNCTVVSGTDGSSANTFSAGGEDNGTNLYVNKKFTVDNSSLTTTFKSPVLSALTLGNVQVDSAKVKKSGSGYSANGTASVTYGSSSYTVTAETVSSKILLQEGASIFDLFEGPVKKTVLSAVYLNGYSNGGLAREPEFDTDDLEIAGVDYFDQKEGNIYLKNITNDTLDWDASKVTDGRIVKIIYYIPWEEIETAIQTSIIDTAAREYQRATVGDLNVDTLLAQREMLSKMEGTAKDIRRRNLNIFTSGDPSVRRAARRGGGVGYNDPDLRRKWRGVQ